MEGEVPQPSPAEIEEIRTIFKRKVEELGIGEECEAATLEKVSSQPEYVARFWRHLREAPGNVTENAANMIINTAKWRKEFGAADIREAEFSPESKNKGALFARNRDRDGKRLLVFCVGKHVKGVVKMEEMKRFFVYYLEKISRQEDGGQFTVVFDCQGAGLKNMDMEFVQFLIGVMRDYYPDPLNYILVYEMPWVLNAAFKVIKAWLPPAAVRKIKFLTKGNMGEYIDPENRLASWGGEDAWEFQWESEGEEGGGRKKTVTFASPSLMSGSQSAESLGSTGSTLSVSQAAPGTAPGSNLQQDIIRITPHNEVVFSPSAPSGELVAKMSILNIGSRVVGYKIKTTSPEKYRVRPSTGILGLGNTAQVEIHVASAEGGGANTVLSKDKFLVTAVFLEKEDISPTQLQETLKQSSPDGQYRLRCQVAGAGGEPGAPAPPALLGASASKQLTGRGDSADHQSPLVKQLSKLSERQLVVEEQLRLVVKLQILLVGLLVLILVLSFYYRNSPPETDVFLNDQSLNASGNVSKEDL